jgi:quinol monooxygenase YgiN
MAVTRINKFEARPGMEKDLQAFLSSIISLVLQAQGCQFCQLLRAQDNPAELVIIEVWDSVDAHQIAGKSIPPEKIAQVMPMLANPPLGTYYTE